MTDKMIIRPSSIDTFFQCPQQWYRVFIKGGISIPSSRAAIGTAIHAGVEEMWKDSMKATVKITSESSMQDAAMMAWDEEEQKGMRYDDNESANSCEKEIVSGLGVFVEDILPFVDIPTGVEQRFTVNIPNHPLIGGVSGTVDYINKNTGVLADVKTGKRKHNVANSETQQSVYSFLAEENGIPVKSATIQNVVLKTKPDGHIMDARINIPKAKTLINTILDVTEIYAEDKVDPEILFRGNPKYYLCSKKYCAFHSSCKYVGN